MKKIKVTDIMKRVPWIILAIQLFLVIYAGTTFKVDDTTLYKGDIDEFNTGWTLVRADGSEESIELPYYEECAADTIVTIKNVIPEKYWGKTISFLTADKNVRVYIDGEVVYEFGVNDERSFGHTPGSITNFIDIPLDLTEGKIVIELISPYDNYGACIASMTIANRDIAILDMFNTNMFEFGCAIIMMLTSIVFCVLAWSHRWVKRDTEGVEFLAVYSLLSFVYYCIETKAMHLLYGNHTLHSILVFLILMSLPLFLLTYYMKRFKLEGSRSLQVMHALSVFNICIQIPLQVFNVVDFMNMAFLSHGILFVSIIVMIVQLYRLWIKDKNARNRLELAGLLIMGICGVADIVRSYMLKIEHIEKISRYGTTVFCLLMLIAHLIRLVKKYVEALEENTKLLEQKVQLVESKNEAKSIFLARMSHEIRTPINAVLGMNKMIIRETDDDNIREYAEDVESAAQALLGIVNEILDLSKIESGKMSLVEGEYDVSSMLYDISNMIAVRAETKQLDFIVNVDESIPSVLYGDDVKLRQILTNILSNAVKYTNEGLVTMAVLCERASDELVKLTFKIKDTGIGIKEEDMPKLFEAFERIDEGRNRAIEGTGLGMSITVQFLKLMNSTLNVESRYGEGSTFSFTVEQRIVNDTPIGDFAEKFRLRRQKYVQKSDVNTSGRKVLLVDDNNVNRRVFASLLKHTGIQVVEASGGKEALSLVTKEHYDIIFLDHMMPEMDGIETLKMMKELDENANKNASTPVIALTANAISGAKDYYMTEGFDGYMSKPIEPDKLDKLIKQYI